MSDPVAPPTAPSTLLDRVLSGAAMFVAVSSLALSVYEARMTRQHDKLSVWPSVSAFNSDSGDVYTFNVRNDGTGPATLRSLQILVDGRPQHRWSEVIDAFLDSASRARIQALSSSVGRGTVLLPGPRVPLVTIGPADVGLAFHREASKRMRAIMCYCSLYEDCWTYDDGDDAPEPRAVSACPAVATEFAR